MIIYCCARCKSILETPESLIGSAESCPVCHSRNVVPAVSATCTPYQDLGKDLVLIGSIFLLAGGGLAGFGLIERSWVAICLGGTIAVIGYALRNRHRSGTSKRGNARKYCQHCGPVMAYRKAPDYLLHTALALGTCGASIVLFVIDCLSKRRWRCGTCNRVLVVPKASAPTASPTWKPARQPATSATAGGFWGGLVYAIGFAVGLYATMQMMMGQRAKGTTPEQAAHPNNATPSVVVKAESGGPSGPEAKSLAEVQAAIKHGADPNAPIRDGLSPLHWAARNGFASVARLLIEHGANVNLQAQGMEGATPLHVVAVYGHKAVAEALLAAGAEVNAMDKWGSTPLQYASFNGHEQLLGLLISNGARINNRDRRFGVTAVQVATAAGKENTVRLLVGKGADINTRNNAGETPLGTALRMKHSDIIRLLKRYGARE